MLATVNYSPRSEIPSLKSFLTAVSNGVRHIFLDIDFKELFFKSEYDWDLFENAFQESYERFQDRLKNLERYYYWDNRYSDSFYWRDIDLIAQTGFNGRSLESKIAFWNVLVDRYNRIFGSTENRPEIWKTIIKAVLDFCNIILESAKLLTGNDSLKEMKDLGEWIIKNSLGL